MNGNNGATNLRSIFVLLRSTSMGFYSVIHLVSGQHGKRADPSITALRTRPCPPIFRPGSQLTDLKFFSVPPDAVPVSPSITRDPRRPAKEASLSEKGSTYLAATFLDFEDCKSRQIMQSLWANIDIFILLDTALPKQQVSIYSMNRFGQMDITWVGRFQLQSI